MKTRTLLLALVNFVFTTSVFAYTAQFHAGAGTVGGQTDFSLNETGGDGTGLTLPTPTLSGCSDWEFAGWVLGSPYTLSDEMTQTLYPAESTYNLSSVSEDFYAVYRYKSNRYTGVYVNDQLLSGGQYLVVNTDRYHSLYFNTESAFLTGLHIWAYSLNDYSSAKWAQGYVDFEMSNDTYKSLPVTLKEENTTNHYWSIYNAFRNKYIEFDDFKQIGSCTGDATCTIAKTDWELFNLRGVNSNTLLGGDNLQTGWGGLFDAFPQYNLNSNNFYIYRQQTFYSSTPDCGAVSYTVNYNAGTTGLVSPTSDREGGYHQGLVLPAATLNTGGAPCNAQWEFAGWTESGSTLAEDDANLLVRLWLDGEVYYPTRTETLHAVYRRKTKQWEQVEDLGSLYAGEKVLIAYKDGDNYYLLSSAASSTTGCNAAVAKSISEITSVDDAALIWTLEGVPGAWRLRDSSNEKKHLDMTRSGYACSYKYPWSRWSDEFTISGTTNFSVRSNYAGKQYLTATSSNFSSQVAPQSNICIFRQVTVYSKTPRCDEYTVLFNSGEGFFEDVLNSTIALDNISSQTGLPLDSIAVPTAEAPDCEGADWQFSGWRVGSGLNATTNAPGLLYKSTDRYTPMQDSIVLYAVYQNGGGEIYYEKVNSKSEITAGDTYVIVYTGNSKAVRRTGKGAWDGKTVNPDNGIIDDDEVEAAMKWIYNGTYFYNGTDDDNHRLARNGTEGYAGQVTNTSTPFKLQYTTTGWGSATYNLRWETNKFNYSTTTTSYNTFEIYKQKTTAAEYNSWPHCMPFTVVLNACGGTFESGKDTIHLKEPNAGDGVSLDGQTLSVTCAGWTLAGWIEGQSVQARTSVPSGMWAIDDDYTPKQDQDQLYAVYSNGSIYTSYPACGEGIDVVEWTTDSIIVESYILSGTPALNGKSGHANSDGTYSLYYNVANNPCAPLLLEWGGVRQFVKTPLLVNSYTRTSAVTGAVANCSSCDMVVLNGGTAIVDQTTTIHDLTVYPGGRFNLASGKTFEASSLTMRTNGDELAPVAVIQGSFSCSTLNHDRRIDKDRYYWMALPYDVTITNINYANAEANGADAELDEHYYLKFYNGVARARDHGTQSTYWTHILDGDGSVQSTTTLNAGRGYLIGLPPTAQNATGHKYRTLRFPMAVANWNSEKDIDKTVVAAGENAGEYVQHIGWNLIGNPFLQNYSAVDVDDVACGRLTEHLDEGGNWVDPWYEIVDDETKNIPYITLYDPRSQTYTQTQFVGQNLPPFSAAFVQLPANVNGIHFSGTAISKSSAPARRMGLLNEDEKSVFSIKGLSKSIDQFTIIVDNQYGSDYEIGADLLKMQNADKTNIYSVHGGMQQVFDALSYEDADSIPVGYTQPVAGDMIIGVETLQQSDEVEHVWLVDNEQHTQTDLLLAPYVFSSEAGMFNDRFWISIGKREVPTWILPVGDNGDSQPYKFIRDGQLFIQRDGKIYNASGVQIR